MSTKVLLANDIRQRERIKREHPDLADHVVVTNRSINRLRGMSVEFITQAADFQGASPELENYLTVACLPRRLQR